jgi:hypothetical protein
MRQIGTVPVMEMLHITIKTGIQETDDVGLPELLSTNANNFAAASSGGMLDESRVKL